MSSASDVESDGTPTQPLLDALSTARFQQRLLSLVGEKEGAERRVQELERSVHHAEATLKAALDSRSEVQANLRASERRIQEAEAAADRHLAAVESEKQRYAILARLADDQAAESKAKISAQGEQLHVLNEQLGAANRAVGTLRAHQSSSDQHIESFHAKVSEVTLMLETVRAAERTCRGTVGRIVEEQSSARLQLSAIERTQASVVGRAKLVAQLKAAREVAKEKDALSSSRLEEMKVRACQRLA
ncbi:hypothetical protein EMIHUDRAFT_97438 [Emiliania huxleyi CCMP1516]|jgi:chromosome segregation ATPase|uniref:Uncharacterized protein n=2 Tax=Emiliania huxleyi TaxID=2903 RepID=A0A0D3KZK6_EMIH1|nr:hypothetical protein EMIHUDRAFT_97438 [Emiliania huxleyi CCMP1516]EOD41191.1 hypothetical protein EMIHUDRAFT_97438 [Emiliania huxleyi CCMP1516]|eukprot:XP_005793620.1 hypothetical protein EMIHUDRAFT_97438 [Emiliania huxleyi CCMP1516]